MAGKLNTRENPEAPADNRGEALPPRRTRVMTIGGRPVNMKMLKFVNFLRTILLYFAFAISVYAFVYLLILASVGSFGNENWLLIVEGYPPIEDEEVGYLSLSQAMTVSNFVFLNWVHIVTACILLWIAFAITIRNVLLVAASGIRVVQHPGFPRFRVIVEDMCRKTGVDMPRLALIPSRYMNAFTAGMFRDEAMIVVTTGLLERLNDDELEAVMGHEFTHILNRDVAVMSVASIIVGSIGTLADWAYWRAVSRTTEEADSDGIFSDSGGYNLASIFVLLIVSFMASVGWVITSIS
ncbi:MAG: M48 family metalloprotease, partial [Methylobacteriaceae bacterium]|nr:M48 family metalloprotease [Methylobacteriaceae bacterium]